MAAIVYPVARRPRDREVRPPLFLVPGDGARRPAAARRVYRRRRLVVVAVVVGLALGVAALAALSAGRAPAASVGGTAAPATASADARVYVVQPGDTFWAIAERLDPQGDVRATVDRLVAAHGGARLDAGDRVVLGP